MISALTLTILMAAPPTDASNVYALSPEAFVETAKHDITTLQQFVGGLKNVQQSVKQQRTLFSTKSDTVYSPEQKQTLLSTWGSLFAWFSAIEGLRQKYWGFVKLSPTDPRHAWGFLMTHTALTALLANGLAFAQLTLDNKQIETLLDEKNDDYGVPAGAYAAFKLKAIHIATSTQLLTGDNYGLVAVPLLKRRTEAKDPSVKWAIDEMQADSKAAKQALLKRGVKLFLGNAKDVVVDTSAQTIFPAQSAFAEWMGDTRVARIGKPLLTRENIDQWVLPVLAPGDIIVTRQNWFLSNIGLPGFWPHAELYVGAADDLKKAFDADPDVVLWVKAQTEHVSTFSELLQKRYPAKWKAYAEGADFQGHKPIRVIESISEGVSFTAVEHAFGVDYLGALRPRVTGLDKARAVERAFGYQGRPYDFDFDFFSDTSLVCTELVYKAYQPSKEEHGVTIDLVNVAGRRTLPANEIVHRYDSDHDGASPQMDFVVFVDGQEKLGTAKLSDEASFRQSYKRLKWDLAQH